MKKLLILISALFLLACSDPKEANKENFIKAISAWKSIQKACFSLPSNFPIEIQKDSGEGNGRNLTVLNELASMGFLKKEDAMVQEKKFTFTRVPKQVPGYRFTATEQAKDLIVEPEKKGLFSSTEICYGTYEINDVKLFSEPTEFMGETISRVTYLYSLGYAAEWAVTNKKLLENVSVLAKDVASMNTPYEGKAVLVLTNEGWMHSKLYDSGKKMAWN